MTSLIHWYVPLSTPDLRTHNSFTTPHLVGVIFLSEAYNDIRLAEAMVHEFHHAELHALMEANEVVEYREDELFYSPWRPDPRPLYGLFHALHVFTGVIDFYRKAETTEELGAQVDEIRRLRQEICFKIRLGLAQVPREVPAEMGRKILESIEQELAGQEAELDIAHRPIPDKLLTHLNTWKGRNADLVSRVRMP
jgi:HEXXH motif-containing protein